ncbi:MAG: triose-phosphate isomerase [Chloroflexota bacterium]|nr:triose-phosphate isomerase [Chloroflexota bacterium]
MRRPVVAANWKMNPATEAEALSLARTVVSGVAGVEATTVLCPPTIWLTIVSRALDGDLAVGAQTMAAEERGAFTGETSPLMLRGIADWVIVGHSERRQYDGETDERVGRKVASAVAHALRPIAAIGERIGERKAGETAAVIDRQLRAALIGLERIAGSGLAIAYEPVWAIGTGNAASGHDAQAAAAQIRDILHELDPIGADEVPILYGGSVTAANAAEFFGQLDVDGALVGGASLDPEGFAAIVASAAGAAS